MPSPAPAPGPALIALNLHLPQRLIGGAAGLGGGVQDGGGVPDGACTWTQRGSPRLSPRLPRPHSAPPASPCLAPSPLCRQLFLAWANTLVPTSSPPPPSRSSSSHLSCARRRRPRAIASRQRPCAITLAPGIVPGIVPSPSLLGQCSRAVLRAVLGQYSGGSRAVLGAVLAQCSRGAHAVENQCAMVAHSVLRAVLKRNQNLGAGPRRSPCKILWTKHLFYILMPTC